MSDDILEKTPTKLQSWHKTAVLWILFFIIIISGVMFVQKKPSTPIFVDTTALSADEASEIYALIGTLGDVKFHEADLNAIADKAKELSWVDSVKVNRDWSEGIVVVATPRTPVANFGSEYLLDVSGVAFIPADKAKLNNPNFVRLYGEHNQSKEIMQKLYKLNEWFAPMNISVKDIILTPRHTWLVRFDNGLRVTVDYDRVDEKLFELSLILKEGSMPIAFDNIAAIDLRYKNGFSITKKGS